MSRARMKICSSCERNQAGLLSSLCGSCETKNEEECKEEAFKELVFKLAEAAVEANLNGVGMNIQKLLEEARGY